MNKKDWNWVGVNEIAVLLLLFIVLGLVFVPNARTTLWADWEFSGWIAPIANRFNSGLVLYSDGGHVPLPPLPFVLVYLLTNGQATWFTESLLNYLFQVATILLMYLGLSFYLPRPIPFLAALGTIPVFLALPKTILYDANVQFFAAATALAVVSYAGLPTLTFKSRAIKYPDNNSGNPQAPDTPASLSLTKVGILGLCCSLSILTKQSTGAGALGGVIMLLLLFPRSITLAARFRRILIFLGATFLAFVPLCLAMSPFINISGFITDVFLTGSEPKGGIWRFLTNFLGYFKELGALMLGVGLATLIFFGFLGRPEPTPSDLGQSETRSPGYITNLFDTRWAIPVASLTAISVLGAMLFNNGIGLFLSAFISLGFFLLSSGLALTLIITLGFCLRSRLTERPYFEIISAFTLATFPAMLGHTLSVTEFRWWYDNNPLIIITLAALFLILLPTVGTLFQGQPRRARAVLLATIGLTLIPLWLLLNTELTAAGKANEKWPEISYLANAELPRRGADMRDLVQLVRDLTNTAGKDEVLLLPNDPNVEAWFDRPRPKLTSAIIFTDQYWDKYVETDLARLKTKPPQVIIIGPQGFWRSFSRIWNKNWGAERLIDRIQTDLLPDYYELNRDFEILFQGRTEIMSIYVKK